MTVGFLAIENFLNRYRERALIEKALETIRTEILKILEHDPLLMQGLRQFISGMPLDTIGTSAHPKRLKQIMLEALLSPRTLQLEQLHTDRDPATTVQLSEVKRDLHYYIKLTSLYQEPISARELLFSILKKSASLSQGERSELLALSRKLPFVHPTDAAFCASELSQTAPITLNPQQIVAPVLVRPKELSPDIALIGLELFRRFTAIQEDIIARAGETYQSMQQRVAEQQLLIRDFKKEIKALPSEMRDALYAFAEKRWSSFAGEKPQREILSDYLSLLTHS
jgi:hypothetical protein